MLKKEIENLFLTLELQPHQNCWKKIFGAVLLIVLSFKYTVYHFSSICIGVRWQSSFFQRLKKSYVKEWKLSRSPVPNLGLTNIRPFSQLLPVQRLPAQAGSTWLAQEAEDKATIPERWNWAHSSRTNKAWVHVASASDLIQALG